MFRRKRAADAVPPPDPALLTLADTCGAAARATGSLREAVDVVLGQVADATGWAAGHAWVPGDEPGTWVSAGLWHPEDGMAMGGLRHACEVAAPAPARGHLALALHLETTQWVGDLSGLTGTDLHDAAAAAGVVAAVACPVYVAGVPVALLEWYLMSDRPLSPEVAHVLGHLSAVLTEVAERPAVHHIPSQGRMPSVRETLRWVTEDGVLERLLTC
jgi:hypothetical protein